MVIRKEGWQVEIVREFEIDMYTLIYLKMITNKDLLYSIGILFNILQQPIWEKNLKEEWIYVYL